MWLPLYLDQPIWSNLQFLTFEVQAFWMLCSDLFRFSRRSGDQCLLVLIRKPVWPVVARGMLNMFLPILHPLVQYLVLILQSSSGVAQLVNHRPVFLSLLFLPTCLVSCGIPAINEQAKGPSFEFRLSQCIVYVINVKRKTSNKPHHVLHVLQPFLAQPA